MIELVAFLGNPGAEYAGSRHNAGWLLAQKLPFAAGLLWKQKFKGRWAAMESYALPMTEPPAPVLPNGKTKNARQRDAPLPPAETGSVPELPMRIHFLMPGTFMNLSGESVLAAASFFKTAPQKILVVHDELELPLGVVSLKFSGGLGGHNGLRSMKEKFATADFWRLRVGIGRPDDRAPGQGGREGSGRGIVDWVLSDFGPAEIPALESALAAGALLLTGLLRYGPEKYLPEWNKKKVETTP